MSVYASPEEVAAFRVSVEARKLKAAQRKTAHQERLAKMSQEERALYDAKALRKAEGRQRWLEEYRTLDKKTKKERRDAKKKAAADRKNIREGKRELRAIRRHIGGLRDMINGMQLIEKEEKLTEEKKLWQQEEQ